MGVLPLRVLLTARIHPDADAMLRGFAEPVLAPDPDPETLHRLAADVDGIIVRNVLPDDIFIRAPRLRAAVRHGAGLDFIPLEAARASGVKVANVPGVNARAVAEFCIAALLHLRRPVAKLDQTLRAEGWNKARALPIGFSELGDTTLGIIGMGAIGRTVARIAHGFSMNVQAVRHSRPLPDEIEETDLDTIFATSDHIVLSCPLTPKTRGLVGREQFALMKPGAVLVNISRGPVVDTPALVEALTSGKIGGAATDVYDAKPVPLEHPLFGCPNLLMTPHCAGTIPRVSRELSLAAVGEMRRILQGEEPLNPVALAV